MPTSQGHTTPPLLERPMPGVPLPVLETASGRQVRLSAHALTEGLTLVALRSWVLPRNSSEWKPLRGTLLIQLWQVEELIAALTEVAEAARDVKRGRTPHAR